jgi:adenylate cyclase
VAERVERRLAAILCADVAGYSRLMGADEEGTLAALRAHRREVIDPLLASHQGRIVKSTGDGLLVEFASVVDAVRAAVLVQQGMASREADLPEDRRMRLRIGINLGDIIGEADDIFGDGVNVAARLEALAEPGGICISGAVHEQIGNRLPFAYADLGEHSVKNIARPVHVYAVATDAASPPAAAAASDRPSIAVLPFTNMSGDPEQDYFADGIVEDIITGLSRIRWLLVIARNSTFVYKGKPVDVKQVARALDVRYVLEGSVRRSGNRLRITGQLIDAGSGGHLWAERYDGTVDDVFALQDEITLSVVGAIEPSLRQAEIERVKRRRPDSFDAYDLQLRALALANSAMPEDATKALPLVEQALALEPDYAAAHGIAAWCHQNRFLRGGLDEADRVAALRHARAAIAAGSEDATALSLGGFVLALLGGDPAGALDAFERALALNPSSLFALNYGAIALAWQGQSERAIQWAERALRLSPFDPLRYGCYNALAVAHFVVRRYEASVAAVNRALQVNPRFSLSYAILAAALAALGRVEEATAAAAQVRALEPGFDPLKMAAGARLAPEVMGPFTAAWRLVGLAD